MTITSAVHRPFVQRVELQAESNASIEEAKAALPDLGGIVSIGLLNDGVRSITVSDLRWHGKTAAAHTADLQLIWRRLSPDPLPAGAEGELLLCLRNRMSSDTAIEMTLSDGRHCTAEVPASAPLPRFEGIWFEQGLRRLWLYISLPQQASPDAFRLFRNGAEITAGLRWLPSSVMSGLVAAVLDLAEAIPRGSPQTFRLTGTGVPIVASVRAFDRSAIFGTYGRADFERQAFNGLTGFNSFGTVSRESLDQADRLGIRCAIMTGSNPPPSSYGHPGLYAYVLTDEPDCKDYGVQDRPMGKRIGAYAPLMLDHAEHCHALDAATPTLLTLNLTFTPSNYFIYGPIADIANPDCYPITVGWSVRVVRNYLTTVREATAPRPFCYTYQGSWEEYARKQPGGYVGGDTLRKKGWETFRDPDRIRGLGRPPDPAEVHIMMLYGIGCGAKGLFSYIDASELCGTLMFHGSEDLPEIWHTIGLTSRMLDRVAPLIEIAQPTSLAASDRESLWVSTLLAGDRGLLIVVVNEDFSCDPEGFRQRAAQSARFTIPTLPWMKDWRVVKTGDGKWIDVSSRPIEKQIVWHDSVDTGALYLLAPTATLDALAGRDRRHRIDRALALVSTRRDRLRREHARRMRVRDLLRGPAETRLGGEPLNGYGVTDKTLWDPRGETYNGIEFWEHKGTTPLGVRWKVPVSETMVGKPHRFVWQGRLYGGAVMLTVTDDVGGYLLKTELLGVSAMTIREQAVEFEKPGDHTIGISVTPDLPREHGGRVARVAFLLPAFE